MKSNIFTFLILTGVISVNVSCRSTKDFEEESLLDSSRTPFPSTIPGISLGGAHIVLKDGSNTKIIRSQAPHTDKEFKELTEFGVTDVVIFKKETNHEVQNELLELKDHGFPASRITNIPMQYRDFKDFEEPCRYTLKALKTIHEARQDEGRMILIHCTVGEDRTGFLSGLVKLLENGGDTKEIFKTEMCKNGYSSGNPKKPKSITTRIDEDLTPIFTRLALLIKKGSLTWNHLDADTLCTSDPFNDRLTSTLRTEFNPSNYRCE
jgi:protein-tyrosine phosphatase